MNVDKEETQEIIENHFIEDIKFEPKSVRNFFTNNLIYRTMSRLIGTTADGYTRTLRCTSSGTLFVSSSGGGLEVNVTYTGTCADAYGTAIIPVVTANIVEIWVNTYGVKIKRSNNIISYHDEITLQANSYYKFEASTAMLNIKNLVAGQNATYQIVLWY